MQDISPKKPFKINDLSPEETGRLVDVFAWLLEEDKKQNPAFYELKKQRND